MRKLLLATLMFTLTIGGLIAQENAVESPSTERDFSQWKTFFYDMTKAERLEFTNSPYYDHEKVMSWVDDQKAINQYVTGNYPKAVVSDCDNTSYWIENDDSFTTTSGGAFVISNGQSGCIPAVDCAIGPISLFDEWGENFCFFDESFPEFYINANGNITFEGPNTDWVPEPFPASTGLNRIAPLWADHDFTAGGNCHYVVDPSGFAVITWDNVGYWNNGGELRNTYQIILTNGTSDILPDGNNVAIIYQDVQWASGDWAGGSNGQNGNAGTSGLDTEGGGGAPGFQYGSFLFTNSDYDGPVGQPDGIDWLDNKTFLSNTCVTSDENQPPVFANIFPTDTLFMCQGDTLDMIYTWLSTESGESLTLESTLPTFDGFTIEQELDGTVAIFDGEVVANAGNVGTYDFSFTVTDDADIPLSTTLDFVLSISNIVVPEMTVVVDPELNPDSLCNGGQTPLLATPGFDDYCWSTQCTGPECVVTNEGFYTVQGILGGCVAEAEILLDFPPITAALCNSFTMTPGYFACNDTVNAEINFNLVQWTDPVWSALDPLNGLPYTEDGAILGDSINTFSTDLLAGTYFVTAVDENGCLNQCVLDVFPQPVLLPDYPEQEIFCDGLEPYDFEGAYDVGPPNFDPGSINFVLYDGNGDNSWDGSYINISVNGENISPYLTSVLTNVEDITLDGFSNASAILTDFIFPFDEIVVTFFSGGGDNTGDNIQMSFTNGCGVTQTVQLEDLADGSVILDFEADCLIESEGTWAITSTVDESLTQLSDDDEFETTFTPNDFGIYTLTYSTGFCPDIFSIDLIYDIEVEVDLDVTDTIFLCDEESFLIGTIYDNPLGLGVISEPFPNPISEFNGEWVASIESPCYTDDASVFVVSGSSDIDFTNSFDEVLCEEGEILLDPIESNPGDPTLTYDWEGPGNAIDNTSDSVWVADESGFYTVTINGLCIDPFTVDGDLTIYESTEGLINGNFVCDNNIANVSTTPSYDSYLWSDGSTDSSTSFTSEGEISVTVTNVCDTITITEAVVFSNSISAFGEGDDFVACAGTPLTLAPTLSGNITFREWTASYTNEILGTSGTYDVISENIPPADLGNITYTLELNGACNDEPVFLEFDVLTDLCELDLYNIFSPNNDNINEGWIIGGLETLTFPVNVSVFNRWGVVVYENSNYKNSDPWDGGDLNEGTYFYSIDIPDLDRQYSGYVTLVR